MTTAPYSRMLLTIHGASDADQQELEEQTQSLAAELEPVAIVERVTDPSSPAGSKGIGIDIVGQLLLSIVHEGGMLVTAIGAIEAWLLRQNARSVTLELGGNRIEVKGVSDDERKRMITAWIKAIEKQSAEKSP